MLIDFFDRFLMPRFVSPGPMNVRLRPLRGARAHGRAGPPSHGSCRVTEAPQQLLCLRPQGQQSVGGRGRSCKNKDRVVHLTPSRGHCTTFSSTIPPLQVALSFACSVASLSHSPSLQLPGWHGLHHGSLADYLLVWGRASTCLAGLARTPVHAPAQAP